MNRLERNFGALDHQIGAIMRAMQIVKPDDLNEEEKLKLNGFLEKTMAGLGLVNTVLLQCMERNKLEGNDLGERFAKERRAEQFKRDLLTGKGAKVIKG